MNRQQIEDMLNHYNRNKARAAYLKSQLEAAGRQLAALEACSIEDRVRLTAVPTATPAGNIGGQRDPVGDLAARDADGEESPRLRLMRRDMAAWREAVSQAEAQTAAVDAWLLALAPREAWLVTHRHIQGESWRQLHPAYNAAFGDDYCRDSLKRLVRRALDRIEEVAS